MARCAKQGGTGLASLKAAVHSFVLDLSNELREGVNWRAVALTLVMLAGAGSVAWFAGSADPRYHSFCSRPSDTEIVLFMSALPFLAGATIVAIVLAKLLGRLPIFSAQAALHEDDDVAAADGPVQEKA